MITNESFPRLGFSNSLRTNRDLHRVERGSLKGIWIAKFKVKASSRYVLGKSCGLGWDLKAKPLSCIATGLSAFPQTRLFRNLRKSIPASQELPSLSTILSHQFARSERHIDTGPTSLKGINSFNSHV